MFAKKKCAPCYMSHPILCGMIASFAIIGVAGVVMAVKSKARRLATAAKRMGCDCVDHVKEVTEDMLDDGAEAVEDMIDRMRG